MDKYTPKPWVLSTDYDDYGDPALLVNKDTFASDADMRLIAVAPDLFELLKFMVDSYVPSAANIVFGEGWVKEAKFTISKVLGESA